MASFKTRRNKNLVKLFLKISQYIFGISLVVVAGFFLFLKSKNNYQQNRSLNFSYEQNIEIVDKSNENKVHKIKKTTDKFKPPKTVKGIYLTAYSAGKKERLQKYLDLIDQTELNAVVIDVKDYTGKILYNSKLRQVNQLGLKNVLIDDLKKLVNLLHEHNIYVIARQSVFQDPALSYLKPEWSIKNVYGQVWTDYKGLSWVDPNKRQVWIYNLKIAQELADLGVDEINFDYVRFPSDGNLKIIKYSSYISKEDVLGSFFSFLKTNLKKKDVVFSVDLFGFVMERERLNIGQSLDIVLPYVDIVCPMMYPSHYPSGHLGLKNPADYPQLVLENGLKKGLVKFKKYSTKLRPWLQAFNLGAIYDGEKIRTQIETVEKYSSAGWLLWNARNYYTDAGLKKK